MTKVKRLTYLKMYFHHFSDLQIYGNETISMYRGKNMGDLDPHVYAVAEEAFKRMERYLWRTFMKRLFCCCINVYVESK